MILQFFLPSTLYTTWCVLVAKGNKGYILIWLPVDIHEK